ncbi:hypothetical protein CHS0354_012804 [Potamilus streckersoni]|uniref:L-dopachrome isomerase n=1 Tax=Potamilus streckersoni TaxID=2493646 RepID=A0AAE0SX25_9BIVA|nr:hypothetical protein CHS0354_012804 [Potamilus streckersoni]
MTLTHVTVVLRTNVPPESIQKEFLSKMTTFISNLFGAETGNVVVELHTNIQMMRAGSTSPMINMNVHHNSDKVGTAKVELAGSIAQFLSREISMPFDRTQVLFFDTRKCS